MTDLLERLPENFEMITMQLRAKTLLEGEAGPFVVVALQVKGNLSVKIHSTSPVPVGDETNPLIHLWLQPYACFLASFTPTQLATTPSNDCSAGVFTHECALVGDSEIVGGARQGFEGTAKHVAKYGGPCNRVWPQRMARPKPLCAGSWHASW